MTENEGVVVFTAQGEFEEQQVRSFLGAQGIKTWVRGEALRKTHGLTLNGIGQVEVYVAPDDEAEARQLLEEVERGGFEIGEDHEG